MSGRGCIAMGVLMGPRCSQDLAQCRRRRMLQGPKIKGTS